jgi:hypothetical protein
MGPVIFFLLTVAALLICTPRGERGLALGSMLTVGAALWLAVRINLHSILGSILGAVLALAWEYRNELLVLFGATVVLIVPLLMIYVALRDRVEARAGKSGYPPGAKLRESRFPEKSSRP